MHSRLLTDHHGTRTFAVVSAKVFVDQFVYSPLFAAPVTAALYDFKNRGYALKHVQEFFTARA